MFVNGQSRMHRRRDDGELLSHVVTKLLQVVDGLHALEVPLAVLCGLWWLVWLVRMVPWNVWRGVGSVPVVAELTVSTRAVSASARGHAKSAFLMGAEVMMLWCWRTSVFTCSSACSLPTILSGLRCLSVLVRSVSISSMRLVVVVVHNQIIADVLLIVPVVLVVLAHLFVHF